MLSQVLLQSSAYAEEAESKEQIGLLTLYNCADTNGIFSSLRGEEFGEVPVAGGAVYVRLAKENKLKMGDLYIFISPKTSAFTLVVDFPNDGIDGIACIMGYGEGFTPIADGIRL
jgi:hypothetical protein